MSRHALTLGLAATLCACANTPSPASDARPPASADSSTQTQNPLLAEWTGPYGGVPAFGEMDLSDVEPAATQAIAAHLAELDAIANNDEPPTFENTIVAMQGAGEAMERLQVYMGIWSSNMSTPQSREIFGRLAPKLSEYRTKIVQNAPLFARIKAVKESPALAKRSAREQRLVTLVYNRFARQGADLDAEGKARYAQIQSRLAELHDAFGNNVLADEERTIELGPEDLGGLPESFKTAIKKDGEDVWVLPNTRSAMDPFLTYSTERPLREKVWREYYSRGDHGDEHDTNALITEILGLRHERARLLGYDNFASWRLEDRMAKTPARARELMMKVWPAAIATAKDEVAAMQKLADAEKAGITIEPWDYRYYAEKVRQKTYALDSDEVKQYLQLEQLREAMFMVAGELFGFAFTPVPEGTVPVFHPDVKVWEVTDAASGEHIGLWYLDPFARPGKRSGAWASTYRSSHTYDGKVTVLVSNNSNFIKAPPGQPVLVSADDASTFFHEFGHALHSLSSNVEYPGLAGGVRDYTEFQSQLLERWLFTDAVINEFLRHTETGEPMPKALVEKIRKASTFNQGFSTTEYLASAMMDLELHTIDPAGLDPDTFERETLAKWGMPKEIVMRHRTPHFGHVFSGEGYAAGYYGYLWADVLTSDAAEAFAEAKGGFYDEAVAKKLVEHLFAPRNAVDPAEAYRAFRGRDADVSALMRDRGFSK
ncbi:MAG: M3 family metallopeptidase [Nannocystaceae bacterium]|nr:M3 family metallopeptidase [bacterium]